MQIKSIVIFVLFFTMSAGVSASGFFSTSGFKFVQRRGDTSYSVDVEFPVEGSPAAMKEVKKWICDILEVDAPRRLEESDFQTVLMQSFENYVQFFEGVTRKVEIYRSYEDENVVTYQSVVTDKSDATWRSEDCASFSKQDGHRIRLKEIFKCSERQIKRLMWQFRDQLPVGVSSADGLVVGNAAFADGWIVVIGPAEGYTGAAYRIKYESAEPLLVGNGKKGYYGNITKK